MSLSGVYKGMSAYGRFAGFSLLVCLIATATTGASPAAPGEVTAFKVANKNCSGAAIAAAPARGVLVRLCGKPRKGSATIANLLPNGTIAKLRVTGSGGGPILTGPDDEVWATGYAGESVAIDRIARDGTVRSFPVATEKEFTSIFVRGLVIDREGALWAATGEEEYLGYGYAGRGGELIRIGADGTVTHFRVPEEVEPEGLALGPDGNLWFTGVSGRYSAEHSGSDGVGYVGRMTPTGDMTLFRPPGEGTRPESIAVGPDGRLWFVETGPDRVATIGVDGTFGPRYKLRVGGVDGGLLEGSQGRLVFGPEDDAWIVGFEQLIRMTPNGQQTVFPDATGEAIAVGSEGNIWSVGYGAAFRLVPGAPGIDVSGLVADRGAHTISVHLACGGSSSGCAGMLDLALRNRGEDSLEPAPEKHRFRFVHTSYTVDAESERTLKLQIPASTFALGKRKLPPHLRDKLILRIVATATVAGGPRLERGLRVRVASSNGSAVGEAK